MRLRNDKKYLHEENKYIFPGKVYRQVVLEPLFTEAKEKLFYYLMWINRAHGLMLAEEHIVLAAEMIKVLNVLDEIENEIDWTDFNYDPQFEDLFFLIEHELIKRLGEKIAGQLHTGRSRNDIDATLFRMVLREEVLALGDQLNDFRRIIWQIAHENIETIIPGYTHTQPAQPTTLAHYLIAVLDFLQRDFERLQEYYLRLNLSPMGAGALATTSFKINRESVARYLGFDDILENSYDCIAGSDYLAEASSILIIMMTSLTRVLYDFLLFVMEEFNFINLSDAYVQISSIMPQKRNPVSLEYSRAIATSILGQAGVIFSMLTNTPFGDIVDKEQELQRYLWLSFERTIDLYRLLSVIFNGMEFNRETLAQKVNESFIVVTQLAEDIVQKTGLSFRTAHRIVSNTVKEALIKGLSVKEIDSKLINMIGEKVTGHSINITDEMIERSTDPGFFIKVRKIPGGPAPDEVKNQLKTRGQRLNSDEVWLNEKWAKLNNSLEYLKNQIERIKKH